MTAPMIPPMGEDDQLAQITAREDLEWAVQRVAKMAAIALVNASRLGRKILKGFGYPDEVFSDAQDARALATVLDALTLTRQQHAEQTRSEVEKACAAERAEIAFDIAENPNSEWTKDLRMRHTEPMSARWQELFWALPPGEMRHRLRALEIDTGRSCADRAAPYGPVPVFTAPIDSTDEAIKRAASDTASRLGLFAATWPEFDAFGRACRDRANADSESREAALRAELATVQDARQRNLREVLRLRQEIETLRQEQESAARAAWEEGFRLAQGYGDNAVHFDGEQKERCWRKYQTRLQEKGTTTP